METSLVTNRPFPIIVVMQQYNATVSITSQHISVTPDTSLVETRIEDGKLLYERRW